MHPFHRVRALAVLTAMLLVGGAGAQQPSIDTFFDDFTAAWVRQSPNQATASRYFTGAEQDAFETQLTPSTKQWRRERVALARRGLEQLKVFDRSRLSDVQRTSADLMAWQLGVVVEGEKYEDFEFPLEQFGGVNISLVNALTITHPLNTEKDAVNYVARLRQVAARMNEATSEASSSAEKRMVPPRFIIGVTIAQLEQFISTPAAQNPFVSSFNDRIGQVAAISPARREELRAQAEQITASQIYPAWRNAIEVLKPLQGVATDVAGTVAAARRRRGLRVRSAALHIHELHRGRDSPDRAA